jgi:hypothetical protein
VDTRLQYRVESLNQPAKPIEKSSPAFSILADKSAMNHLAHPP